MSLKPPGAQETLAGVLRNDLCCVGTPDSGQSAVACGEGRESGQSIFDQQYPRPDGCLLRLPQNPVMNSPVVSVAVFHGRNFLRGVLVSPINLEFRLLQTANRSKAICVQWDPPGP